MLAYFIPLLGSYLDSGIFSFLLLPVFCCAVLATLPLIIRAFFRGR